MPRRKYDTPHRSRVVKTRLTEEEYAKFQDECLNEYGAARWCEIMNTAYAAWKG